MSDNDWFWEAVALFWVKNGTDYALVDTFEILYVYFTLHLLWGTNVRTCITSTQLTAHAFLLTIHYYSPPPWTADVLLICIVDNTWTTGGAAPYKIQPVLHQQEAHIYVHTSNIAFISIYNTLRVYSTLQMPISKQKHCT